MIDKMWCGYGTLRTNSVRIWHQVSLRACAEVSAALKVSRRPAQKCQPLRNLTILIVNLVASWMHFHCYRCFQEDMRMLFQSLRALCKAPEGAGSIWKYLEALVRATGVCGRVAYGVWTELHFADAILFKQQGTTLQSFMILTALNPTQSIWYSLIPVWQTIGILFL